MSSGTLWLDVGAQRLVGGVARGDRTDHSANAPACGRQCARRSTDGGVEPPLGDGGGTCVRRRCRRQRRRRRGPRGRSGPAALSYRLGHRGRSLGDDRPFPSQPRGDRACLLPCAARALASDWVVTLSAAACLAWWMRDRAGEGGRRCWRLSRRCPWQPSSATFLPYLSGERTPHNDGSIRGAFVGLSADTSRAALTQAVLEGVAFSFGTASTHCGQPARSLTRPM